MNDMRRKWSHVLHASVSLLTVLLATVVLGHAAELGHYAPAVPRIRDFFVPTPGFHYIQYHLYYTSDTLRDRDGNKVNRIPVGPLTFNVDTEVDAFNVIPALTYVTPWQVLGARYGLLLLQPFGNTTVQAALEETSNPDFALDIDEDGFGLGDTYVRPLWLGWDFGRAELAASYGIYAPSGRYKDGAADNIGLGMWTHEFMLAGALYLDRQRGTALVLAGLYEIHHNKQDVDIRPGSHVTVHYGISQYLPVSKTVLGELAALGYGQWQVTRDSGSDATNKDVKDRIYAIGLQGSLTYLPWQAQLSFHWLHEFAAEARFEGDYFTLTLAKSF
jgi:hypothetical protein